MTDKTIDFSEHLLAESACPLGKFGIIKILEDIQKEDKVIYEYVDHCAKLISDIGLYRDILSSISNRSRCEFLIDSLDEEQLANFSKVASALQKGIELDDFTELYYSTWKLENPTETIIQKASQLIEAIGKKENAGINLESVASEVFYLGKNLRILGGILFNFKKNKFDDRWAIKLAQLSEYDLDQMINLIGDIFKNYEDKSTEISDLQE
jgi:exonuclease VII small subunit